MCPSRRLLDAASLGVVSLQAPEAQISFCSEGLAAMLGSTPGAVEGLKLEDVLCQEDAIRFQVRSLTPPIRPHMPLSLLHPQQCRVPVQYSAVLPQVPLSVLYPELRVPLRVYPQWTHSCFGSVRLWSPVCLG